MSNPDNTPTINVEIAYIDETYVCAECGSDQWHLNVVVKPNGTVQGGANWFADPDCENYCGDCDTMDGRIVSPEEYLESVKEHHDSVSIKKINKKQEVA